MPANPKEYCGKEEGGECERIDLQPPLRLAVFNFCLRPSSFLLLFDALQRQCQRSPEHLPAQLDWNVPRVVGVPDPNLAFGL